jgi:hypothetical protein
MDLQPQMVAFRWFGFCVLLLLGSTAVVGNIGMLISHLLYKTRGSFIPIVGGIFGCMACLVCPNATVFFFWWAPLLIDPGCLPMGIAFLVFIIWKRKEK